MTAALDQSAAVRPGEELPIDRLQAYLQPNFPDALSPLVVEQFPHGHSNLTYLLRLGRRELVLRRPPFGNQVKSAHDMSREYRVLSKLSAVYDKITLDPKLFARIETLYNNRASLNLDAKQTRLLTRTYDSFVRRGAKLNAADKAYIVSRALARRGLGLASRL